MRGFLQGGSTSAATKSMEVRAMAAEMEGIKVRRENQGGVVEQARQTERHEQAYNRDSGARRSIATRQPRRTMLHDPAHPLQKKPSQTPSPPQNLVMDSKNRPDLPCPFPPNSRVDEQEQATGLRSLRERRSPALGRVLGYRSCRRPYPPYRR